jgi:hypothetical protein
MECTCKNDSAFAYIIDNINDEPINKINIQDYLSNSKLFKNKFLVCKNKNELIKYESKKKKSHFKHKNSNGTTEWHLNWQNKFDITEEHIGCRIADAVINNNVIEFQHSYISLNEVTQRSIDYLSQNKNIYWIIDCNDSVIINECRDIFLIKFIKDTWKYEHFTFNEYIYLNIDNKLFRINPKTVKSNMIDVREYNSDDEFINSLNKNINIWNNSEIIQCTLYYKQRGAGCGKTYESIQLLNNTKDKSIFIYLTKMHSAKEVIFNELNEQYNRGELDNLKIYDYCDNISGKQYKFKYMNNITQTECMIIIGTIDSFMYALGDKQNRYNDYFAGIVKSITNGFLDINKNGSTKYSKDTVILNKDCVIIIDEAQDLKKEYIDAICCIMRNTYIDTHVIGDKLQSIWFIENIHTYLEKLGEYDLPNIKIKKDSGINHVKRFHNENFIKFINNIIDFKKYNLPKIEKICDNINCKYKHENNIIPFTIFERKTIYAGEKDDNKVEILIDKIINYIKNEIKNYNYLPHNFMFIFPILANNYLANRLESKLQEFWMKKFNSKKYQENVLNNNEFWKNKINNNNYYKYVYLHKSEEGKSINLKESEYATRILSIHAAKGNGCEVVFVFGITEYSLKLYSKDKCTLIYDSLLHVALTRQKKSLYIGIEKNNDDIYNKFNKFNIEKDTDIKPRIEDIKINNKYPKIIDFSYNINDNFMMIDDNYIKPYNYEKYIPSTNDNTNIIEWGHHIIRYYVFLYYIKLNIYNNEEIEDDNIPMQQFITVISKISKLTIEYYKHNEYYKYIEKNLGKYYKENALSIPILEFNTNEHTKYIKYKKTIYDFMINIQIKINKSLKKNKLPLLCPLEIIILYYMIKIYDDAVFSDLTIMDIYSIIYCYDECSNVINEQHNIYKCLCKNKFNENNNNEIYQDIRESIKNHFEKTKQITLLYNNYKNYLIENFDNPIKFKYNIFHTVVFGETHENFKITNKYVLLAYSDKYVIHFIITPQFNKLNFNNIMCNGIMNKYLLSNSCSEHKNYKRFNNKQIITCIFTLDSIQPIFINFNINNDNIIKKNIKLYLQYEYESKHNIIYDFYHYMKNNKPNNKKNSIKYTYDYINDNDKLKIPEYIKNYFYDILKEIENNKSNKDIILNKVNDLDHFLNNINKYLEKSINNFLNDNNDDDDNF